MQNIKTAITEIKSQYFNLNQATITDEMALNYVALRYFYLTGKRFNLQDCMEMVTDSPHDGGIDFVYYDEEQNKIILGQSKYTKHLDNNSIIAEFDKMSSTVRAFLSGNTGAYSSKVKRELQNALDRLPDEDAGNVEYVLFTTAEINVNNLLLAIGRSERIYSVDMLTIYTSSDISKKIQVSLEELDTVKEAAIQIDKKDNYLEYISGTIEGVMVNISASSIRSIFNSYADKGLFDLNIRRFVTHKLVDKGIKDTLDNDRENFWFYNNGIIIACREYRMDGNKVRLYDFSIVNGGQTTTLIGKHDGLNTKDFYIPCKIISAKDKADKRFYNKIAEATNSQKPIFPRDLRSNAPEMVRLKRWLEKQKICLEIKRGEKKKQKYKHFIKNDDLGQLILSFVYQQPGTSRSGKKSIFDNSQIYNKIYKANYTNDPEKSSFLLDLIDLNERYEIIMEQLKQMPSTPIEKDVIRNGKQIVFALLGVLYSLINQDIKEEDILSNPNAIKDDPFVYAHIIGNYKNDDLDMLLKEILTAIVTVLGASSEKSLNSGDSTSISNYFKSDKKYAEKILTDFVMDYTRFSRRNGLKENGKIFKRDNSNQIGSGVNQVSGQLVF